MAHEWGPGDSRRLTALRSALGCDYFLRSMEQRRKTQFLSAALGPDLYVDLVEEIHAIGEDTWRAPTCLPDVGFEAQRYGLTAADAIFFVRRLAEESFQPSTRESARLTARWPECA